MTTNNAGIRLYVANLGKYNEGELVGGWFTLPVDFEEISEAIGLNDEYEEYAIHDYEAPFEIREYSNINQLNEWAEMLEDNPVDKDVFRAIFNHTNDVDTAIQIVKDGSYSVYHDCNDMADVAYYIFEETGQLDHITAVINESYIDWEAIGRDMDIEGNFEYIGNSCYVEIHH